MWVWSLGWEDPLGKSMATFSSILAWWIPWTEDPGGLQSLELQRVWHDWSNLSRTHALPIILPVLYNRLLWLLCIVKPILIMNNWKSREFKNICHTARWQTKKKKKTEASDSSNLEIIVTSNFSLCDPLQLGHFCCHNLNTNVKMIDCHSTVYSNVLKIQEGLLHLGGYTVFIKRMWTTVLFLCLVVSC